MKSAKASAPLKALSDTSPSDSPEVPAAQNLSLSPIGSLLTAAWSVYKRKFTTLVGIILIGMLQGALVLALVLGAVFIGVLAAPAYKAFISAGLALVAVLFVVYLISRFQLAMILSVAQDCGAGEALESTKGKVASYLWLGLVTAFVMFGGFLLFIVPGILFYVWFFAWAFVFAVEDQRGMDCLLRSRQLVRGKGWAVAGRLLLITMFQIGINFVPLVGSILGLVLSPFSLIYEWILYQELKAAEGTVPSEAPKGRAKILFLSLLGYVLPVILTVFVGSAIVAKVSPSFARLRSQSIQGKASANMAASADTQFAPLPPAEPDPGARFTHEVLLLNGQRLQCTIAKRDSKGLWLELGAGARTYVENREVVEVRELES